MYDLNFFYNPTLINNISLLFKQPMHATDTYEITIDGDKGSPFSLTVSPGDTIQHVKKLIHQKQGILVNRQRLFFNGKELSDKITLSQASIHKGSTIQMLVVILFDIGVFGEHPNAHSRDMLTHHEYQPQKQEINILTQSLRASANAEFYYGNIDVNQEILQNILKFTDEKYEEERSKNNSDIGDLKIDLTRQQLIKLAGDDLVNKLEKLFDSDYTEILIRRCQAHGKLINFHTDFSLKTLQLSLNDDCDYVGGRLVYATKGQLHKPTRQRGSVTIHDNHIAHGVTLLQSGVRYGLFFLKK